MERFWEKSDISWWPWTAEFLESFMPGLLQSRQRPVKKTRPLLKNSKAYNSTGVPTATEE